MMCNNVFSWALAYERAGGTTPGGVHAHAGLPPRQSTTQTCHSRYATLSHSNYIHVYISFYDPLLSYDKCMSFDSNCSQSKNLIITTRT